MKVLFLSLGMFDDLSQGSVHIDLIKRIAEEHDVWLVCKHEGSRTELTEEYGIHVLRVRTGTLKKVGLIKKGINTVMVEPQFKNAIKRYLKDVRFNLVLYTTPPITFASAIKYIKRKDNAITYLLLKDIFPQNAVDLGMMTTTGIKGGIYRFFRNKEKELYELSDYIGCMSPANREYTLIHNPEINPEKVEICPNATVISDERVDAATRQTIRHRYGIPLDKKIFVYGGNLGKPQGIPFLIECLKENSDKNAFFLIIGQGTEYHLLREYIEEEKPSNCRLMKHLPKNEFETLVAACDVGMIFLDHRFTIPNFPSRILSYMKAGIPVLAVTDPNTDIGSVIVDGGFGWWCESNSKRSFSQLIAEIVNSDTEKMGETGFRYLIDNYSVDTAYEIIMDRTVKGKS